MAVIKDGDFEFDLDSDPEELAEKEPAELRRIERQLFRASNDIFGWCCLLDDLIEAKGGGVY